MSDVSQSIISFFVFMFLARKLSPVGYGTLNATMALASLFSIFATNVGANQVITREITLHPDSTKDLFRLLLPIRAISVIATVAALVIYYYWTGENHFIVIFSATLLVFSTTIWDLSESIAFGHFITKLTTMISMAVSGLWLLIVILLPPQYVSYETILLLYSVLFILRGGVYFLFTYQRFIRQKNEPARVRSAAILTMSLPYFWMRIFGTFSDQIPLLLLNGFSGASEVAYFSVGNRFVMPITLAVGTGLRAVFPFMTKLFMEDRESFNQKLIEGFTFVLILGSTLSMILTVTSGFWLPAILGEQYKSAVTAFNYQAWFGVLLSFDLLLSTVLSSTYRQNILAVITTVDVLIFAPMLYFGSHYGAEGLAIARLVGVMLTVSYHIVVVIKVL
jgi:O-antigen/teichoic acid export membrane protein